MNILTDPDLPNDELRRTLYAGHLVVLTRLQTLQGFRRVHPGRAHRTVPAA